MAIYEPILDIKGRTSEFRVLYRWVFNFYVRSTPLLERGEERSELLFYNEHTFKHETSQYV